MYMSCRYHLPSHPGLLEYATRRYRHLYSNASCPNAPRRKRRVVKQRREVEACLIIDREYLTVSGSDVGRVWQSDFLRDNSLFFVVDNPHS